jgi:transforming growth factor-beta-induced protein
MRKLVSIILVLVLSMSTLTAFAAEGDIVDIASGIDDFSTLVAALQEAELVTALQGEGPFTVFAPTDEAFADLLAQLNITAGDLLAHPQLSEVLLYHVVPAKVMSTDLSNGMMAQTLQGEELMIDLTSGVKINQSNVTTADVEATNGVIHVIDTVLVPESFKLMAEPEQDIVDIALGSEDFSMLVSLLQQADLVSTLQSDGPFTVFAPTNDAFNDLLETLDISAAELMAQPDLAKVLLYHVVPAKVMSTDLSNGMKAPTVNGNTLSVDLMNGVKINSSMVTVADIEASNGVVHVIDQVLVPADFTLQNVNMSEGLPKTGDLGLIPYVLFGILSIGGYSYFSKKK